jgi:signal transduction histidine kinase
MGLQRLKREFHPTQDEEEYSHYIELMRGEVQRLNSIVEEFLSLARPLEIKPEEVRMDKLLEELTTFAKADAESANVQIRVVVPHDLPTVRVDRNYLKQVLLNLILNGLQSMPQGGSLTLEAKVSHGNMIVTVADTGEGISQETLSRIFEPYFTTKAKGAGLGLTIARRIVEAHQGTLTVDTTSGKGTRFRIAVPMSRQN